MTDRRAWLAIWPEGERHGGTRQWIAWLQAEPKRGGALARGDRTHRWRARGVAGASAGTVATAVAAIHSMPCSGSAFGADSRTGRQRQQAARNDPAEQRRQPAVSRRQR